MRAAVLRGRAHTTLGQVAAIAEGGLAVALSRGGFTKTYPYKDPNEDVVAFAQAEGGSLLLAADGHGGADAAEKAVDHLMECHAAAWTSADVGDLRERWDETARRVLFETATAAVRHTTQTGASKSRSTLVVCVTRPREGWMGWAALGDSHLFHVATAGEAVDLIHRETDTGFLGNPSDSEESLREKCLSGVEHLAGTRALVLVTDGISEPGIGVEIPESSVAECVEQAARATGPADLRPLTAARSVVEAALDAHRRQRSGDNVASAVHWLDDSAPV